jgi:hypothetical protein
MGPWMQPNPVDKKKQYYSTNDNTCQGILTKEEGLKQLISLLR